MIELSKKIGEMEYDDLFAGLTPPAQTGGVTIRKFGTAGTLKRGTLLGVSSTDGKCVIYVTTAGGGETITPTGVLCDDVDVGTAADVVAVVRHERPAPPPQGRRARRRSHWPRPVQERRAHHLARRGPRRPHVHTKEPQP